MWSAFSWLLYSTESDGIGLHLIIYICLIVIFHELQYKLYDVKNHFLLILTTILIDLQVKC